MPEYRVQFARTSKYMWKLVIQSIKCLVAYIYEAGCVDVWVLCGQGEAMYAGEQTRYLYCK